MVRQWVREYGGEKGFVDWADYERIYREAQRRGGGFTGAEEALGGHSEGASGRGFAGSSWSLSRSATSTGYGFGHTSAAGPLTEVSQALLSRDRLNQLKQ